MASTSTAKSSKFTTWNVKRSDYVAIMKLSEKHGLRVKDFAKVLLRAWSSLSIDEQRKCLLPDES